MGPNLRRIVAMARRRMRLNRALATAGPALLAAGAAAALYALIGRFVLLPDAEALALGVAVVLAVVAIVVAAGVRISDRLAAWAADTWLGTHDAFATAVELRSAPTATLTSTLAEPQIAAAEATAGQVSRLPTGPNVPTRMLTLGAMAVLLAGGLGVLPNPMDDVRTRHEVEQALVEDVIEDLRDQAEELRAAGDEASEQLADELDALADELEEATLAEALELLADRRSELEEGLADDLGSQKTALSGLAQELTRSPLGQGDTVRQQIEDLAQDLQSGELTDEERAALAERLQELADALAAGQPDIADALSDAADALQAGDQQAAANALGAASTAVGDALQSLLDQQALGDAAGALASAEQSLRDGQAALDRGETPTGSAQQGSGQQGSGQQGSGQQGSGQQGSGQQGSGQQGSGQGSGQQGAGQGQGGQAQGGGGGGNPTGSQGQGGTNTGSGTPNAGTAGSLDLATVFDPPTGSIDGEDLQLGGSDSGTGGETTVGSSEGQGTRNLRIVPYLDVLADYQDRATRTIERPGFPVELRDLVRSYFDRIAKLQ